MKRKDFVKKLLSIIPAVSIVNQIKSNPKQPVKEINIDENKNDRLICSSGIVFFNRNCSG